LVEPTNPKTNKNVLAKNINFFICISRFLNYEF